MKRLLIVLAVLILVGLGLLVGSGLVIRTMVSGTAGNALATSLGEKFGVTVSIASADFDLVRWLRLTPAVSLERVSIGNPPGFAGKYLLEAGKISARVALTPLFSRRIDVQALTVEEPRILIERNRQGVSNVEAFIKKLAGSSAPRPKSAAGSSSSETSSLTLEDFQLSSGEIAYADASGTVNLRDINLRLRDIAGNRSCRFQLAAKLFTGKNSTLRLEGHAGPFAAQSLPLDATLAATIAAVDIPPVFRRQEFGSVLAAPGDKARLVLSSSVKGDLYGTLLGPAKLVVSDLLIGKDEKHVLPLAGEAPVTINAGNLMSNPQFHLQMERARLRYGKGEWTGSLDVQSHGSITSGRSSGALRGVDINELVSSLTPENDKIQGTLEMPSYSIQFAGKNADEIRNSLSGSGKLAVKDGRISALDFLTSVQKAMERPQPEAAGAKGATPFTSLTTDLAVANQVIELSGMALDSPALRFTGKGTIGFDRSLRFDLDTNMTGGLGKLVSAVPGMKSGGLAVTVTGTVEEPHVRPNVGKVATSVATDILGSFLKKKVK